MMISREKDREFMDKAVELSTRSQSESDGRIHPFVGAIIVTQNGDHIASAFRGQHTPGHHAEQEALKDIRDDVLVGAVVYSTLEPCTIRGTQTPCCDRLFAAGVSEVVIGMLDPNPDIRGRAWWRFEKSRITVRNFDSDLVQRIHAINAKFIDYQFGLGLQFTQIQPEGQEVIVVSSDHIKGRTIIEVGAYRNTFQGIYRIRPEPGDQIVMFVRKDSRYYPQAPINFNLDRDKQTWEIQNVWLGSNPEEATFEIIIARLSADLNVVRRHYSTVHAESEKWVGIQMDSEPPGFERLAYLTVKRRKI